MIIGSQHAKDSGLQEAGAPVAVPAAVKRRGCRQPDQIVVRFRSEVIFQVPVRYEYETPPCETPLPALSEAGEVLAVV